MTTLEELRARRPGNRTEIDRIKKLMYQDMKLYRLRQLRQELGVTQAELAQRIGVGQNRVSQIERGKIGTARISTLKKYAEALGAGIDIVVKQPDGTFVQLVIDDEEKEEHPTPAA